MSNSADDLLKSMKATAQSRFSAATRLAQHDKALTRLIAFSSVYVVGLTIIPYLTKLSASVTDLFNFVTVILSLVILVSSLMQYSTAEMAKAEQLHRSGLEINEVRRKLSLKANDATHDELSGFVDKYNGVLQKYSINHDHIDFMLYQLQRQEEYPWLKMVGIKGISGLDSVSIDI